MQIAVIGRYIDFLEVKREIREATYIHVDKIRNVFGRTYNHYILLNTDHISRKELNEIIEYLIIHGATRL